MMQSSSLYAFNPAVGLKSFLSPRACALLLESFHLNLRAASLLVTGTATALPVDGLFGVLQRSGAAAAAAAELFEDERTVRMIHYASQAWNLNFFLQSLVRR